MKINELTPEFIEYMPETKEPGKLYISKNLKLAIFICPCGCGYQCVLPFYEKTEQKKSEPQWEYTENDGLISFTPSVQSNCINMAHFYIRNNKIDWC